MNLVFSYVLMALYCISIQPNVATGAFNILLLNRSIDKLIGLCLNNKIDLWLDAYKIDFQNGDNRIHLESTAVQNGKVVNEPKVDEVISTKNIFLDK